MKISIITATYNSQKYIADCLDSVSIQTYKNIEHIVIDGSSNDNTVNIINNYSSVTKLISEPDNGIYEALNKGINLITGDIVGFLHSDDLLASPAIIEEIVKIFEHEFVDGVFGDLIYVKKNEINNIIRYWKSKPLNQRNLKYGWMLAHPTLFLKKEVYQKHGHFSLDYKISADYDFMLRILKDPELKFEYFPNVITKMRVGGISNRGIKNIIQKIKEDLNAIRNNEIGGIYTLLFKNLRKITQFIRKA